MHEGMRIKSKDITFFKSIFYLAINLFIDIFMTGLKQDILENYSLLIHSI